MKGIQELLSHVDQKRALYIMAHDFPDHDAVAAAFGLQYLLMTKGVESTLCYHGAIQSRSLTAAIEWLHIAIHSLSTLTIGADTQVIFVDSSRGNVAPGELIAIVDHHTPTQQPTCRYYDIRENYGSCCTIIYEYYKISKTDIEPRVASALLMGLMMDTAFMTRGVAPIDLEAFATLFGRADWESCARLLRNSLSLNDLRIFRSAMEIAETEGSFCFVPIHYKCTPEVMALVADFFLGLREINFVVAILCYGDEYRLSVRCENPALPVDSIVRQALAGLGTGGGHRYMGGGIMKRERYPGDKQMQLRFLKAIEQLAMDRAHQI